MQEFSSGEHKTAKITMSNPTAMPFDYNAVLYMGVDMVAKANADFHLDGGEEKGVDFSVIMPVDFGTYPVYIDIWSNSTLLGHYKAVEDVSIVPALVYVGDIEGASMSVISPEDELISNRKAYGVQWKVHNPTSSVQSLATTMDIIYRYKYTWYPWATWPEHNTIRGLCEARPPAYQPNKERWVVTQVVYQEAVYGWQPYCSWVEDFAYPYGVALICDYPFVVSIPPGETITIAIPIFMQAAENYYYRVKLHSGAGELESAEFEGRRYG